MKKITKVPLFRLFTLSAISFLAGLIAASFINIEFSGSWRILAYTTAALSAAFLFNFVFKNYWLQIYCLILIFACSGIFYYSYFSYKNIPELPFDSEVIITGQIVKKPEIDYKKQNAVIRISQLEINQSQEHYNKNNLILVELPHYPAVHYGDTVNFKGKIEKPGMINEFDWQKYLKKELVAGVVKSPQNIIAFKKNLSVQQKIYQFLYGISDRFEEAINSILPEPQASLAAGLLFGIKRNIPPDLQNDLNTAGLTHIIALSGYNVTIIVTIFSLFLLYFFNRKTVLMISSFVVIGFVILTGASSSVVRAAIFSLMIIFGRAIGRQGDQTNLLLLAALVMALVNPFILRSDVGFQLSFLAFIGLIYLSPIVEKFIEKGKLALLPEYIKLPLIETLSAQIAVFPLIMVVFGRVSLIGPVANVFILWIIPLAMALSFIAGLAGILFHPLGVLFAMVTWPVLQYIVKVTEFFARFPLASINCQNLNWLVGFAFYFFIATIIFIAKNKYKVKLL